MEQEIVDKDFLGRLGSDLYKTLIKRLMTLIKLRLGFFVTDLSQHFEIYLMAFALKFFIHG